MRKRDEDDEDDVGKEMRMMRRMRMMWDSLGFILRPGKRSRRSSHVLGFLLMGIS